MKKKYYVLIVIFVLILVIGCGSSTKVQASTKLPNENFMIKISYRDEDGNIEEWKDAETGVHYFIYDRKSGYGGMGGICPRYNADGTLYVD